MLFTQTPLLNYKRLQKKNINIISNHVAQFSLIRYQTTLHRGCNHRCGRK